MELKKLHPLVKTAFEEQGVTTPTDLQKQTYSLIKSGVDAVIEGSSEEGKSTAIVLHTLHRLEAPFEASPRALIIVSNKEAVEEMMLKYERFNTYNKLRIYGVHDRTDLDNDKNQISVGIDILIGTPERLSLMFSGAGFDVNRLKMFIVDDADVIFKNRFELKVMRISDSIAKVQRLFFCNEITEKVAVFADKMMIEPEFFFIDNEEEEE